MPQTVDYEALAALARKSGQAPPPGKVPMTVTAQSGPNYSNLASLAKASAPQEEAPRDKPVPVKSVFQQTIDAAKEQIGNQLQGAWRMLTGEAAPPPELPSNLAAARESIAVPGGVSGHITEAAKQVVNPDAYSGVYPTVARGAGALLLPNTVAPPTEGQFKQASEQAGANALGVGLMKAVPAVGEKISSYVPERLMSSLIKPNERAFDFGADPVQAMLDKGVWGKTMAETQGRLKIAKADTELQLKETAQKYSTIYDDVAPTIRKAVAREAAAARADGKDALANQLTELGERKIASIQSRYGTTKLNPEQILNEKRSLAQSTNFTPEATEMSINKTKMGIYSDLDKQMDFMTGNKTAPINKTYAGLIEADSRLATRAQQLKNADVGGDLNIINFPFKLLDKIIPQSFWKTGVAQLLKSTPAGQPQPHSPLPQAFRAPTLEGPGSAGPQGPIPTPVEGGTYRVSEPATGTHPTQLNTAVEGGAYQIPKAGELANEGGKSVVGGNVKPVAVFRIDPLTGENVIIGYYDAATGAMIKGRPQ